MTIRGQIIAPTGSGKTLLEHGAVNLSIKRGGLVHVILAPRIALVHQLLNDFWNYKEGVWNGLCVCSSNAEYEEYYEGEDADLSVKTTTDEEEIKNRILETLESKIPLNIFSTLHSADKIAAALNSCNIECDLAIIDEAHNLTKDAWQQWLTGLPSKRQLSFTATRKISANKDGTGRGMDNRELFGDILHKITPKQLIDTGRIVEPRLHLMYPTTSVDLTHVKKELHAKVMMVVGGALKHAEIMGTSPARMIVFCAGAEEAHDMAELEAIQLALPGWCLGAVTSLADRMGKNKRKAVFKDYLTSPHSILFHYDVVSEGIDLPGTTAILPLRELGEIKIVQAVGRALRITKQDRNAFNNGTIQVGNTAGWEKPYGWILLPILGSEYNWAAQSITDIVYALRSVDFNPDVEHMTVVEQAKTSKPREGDDLSPVLESVTDLFEGLSESLKKINLAVTHEIEIENNVKKNDRPISIVHKTGLFNRIMKQK